MPVTDFRWLVEEDATKDSNPGVPADASNLSLNFHTSYMPVVASGRVGAVPKGPALAVCRLIRRNAITFRCCQTAAATRWAARRCAAGQDSVTIVVNKTPIPTAQISVFVFNDNQPINGTPDLPQELGLAGFSIILKEAGGTYGAIRRPGDPGCVRQSDRNRPTSRTQTAISFSRMARPKC